MKALFTVLALCFSIIAFSQANPGKPVAKQDSVVINLTKLQEDKILDYDKQIKVLQDKSQELFLFILDANKVDQKKIDKVELKPGQLILKLKP